MKAWQHRISVVVAAVWVIALPFLWARLRSWSFGCPYVAILPQYLPDIAIGALALVILPAAWVRKPWAFWALIAAALALFVLKIASGNPTPGAWVISTLLLVIAALGVRSAVDAPSPDMKQLAMRAALTPIYGLAAFGTAAAYVHFVVGVVAGLDGIAEGRTFLGPVLSMLSALAMFAIWRVWSVGSRLWRFGGYFNASPKDRLYDASGLTGAGIAFVGFIAIAKQIHRADDITYFSILLAPAACLAIIAFRWSKHGPRTSPSGDTNEIGANARSSATLKLADLPGFVCGTALGLIGVYYLVPRPISGWGVCDWTVFYPLYRRLWPVERPIVFDACSEDVVTLSMISGVLSLVCLVVGAFAAAIGKSANAARGAWAAASIVAFVLTQLATQVSNTPGAPYIAWVESFIAGVFIVVGAAWLGYLGGERAARWNQRRRMHPRGRADAEAR